MRETQNQPSIVSENATSSITSTNKRVSYLDFNFPLWNQIFMYTKIPALLTYPFMTIFIVQVLLASIWPWASYWKNNNVINQIRTCIYFIKEPSKDIYYLINALIFLALNIFSLSVIGIQTNYYKIQRKFMKSLNYPIKLYFETLIIAIIIPNLIVIGETFSQLFNGDKSWMIIISLIIGIINETYMAGSFIIVQYLNAASIYLSPSLLFNFDPSFIVAITLCTHTSILLYFLLSVFEKWSYLVGIFINIIFFIGILVILLQNMNLVDIMSMSILAGLCCGCITGDILSVVAYFKPDLNNLILYICTFSVFVVAFVVFWIYFFFIIRSIEKKLNEPKNSQEEYDKYYDSLDIANNPTKALLYLRIGFQKSCLCFYNQSLIKYIMVNYDSEKELMLCLYFTNFFPKETSLQNEIKKKLQCLHNLHFSTRFLLFQVESIKMIRQFSDSPQSKLKLLEMKNLSQQCEMMTKIGLDLKFAKTYFENLSKMCMITNALWKEAIYNYPNSPKFCQQYVRYLIEAEGDYLEALRIKEKQNILESGAVFSVDECFKSFVKTFPKYLTAEIIDTEGSLVFKNKDKKEQFNSFVRKPSVIITENFDKIELDNEDYLGKNLIDKSRERTALQRLLSSHVPLPFKLIPRVLAVILFYVVGISIIASVISDHIILNHITNLESLKSISYARFYEALSNVCMEGQFFAEHGGMQKYVLEFRNYLKSTEIFHPFIDMQKPILPNIKNFTQLSSGYYNDFINSLTNQALQGINVYEFITMLIAPVLNYTTYEKHCLLQLQNHASLASIYAMTFTAQRKYSGQQSLYYINIDPDVCELANNFLSLYQGSTLLYANIGDHSEQESKDIKRSFTIYSLCVPAITFFLCNVPLLVLHSLTLKVENKLKEIISTTDLKTRNEAKYPIMLNLQKDEICMTDFGKKKTYRVFLVFMHGVFSMYFFVIVLIACLVVLRTTNNLVKLNSWNRISASRLALSAESFNSLLNVVIMMDVPSSYPQEVHPSFIKLASFILQKFYESDNELVNGVNGSAPCQGFDEELDQLNVIDSTIDQNVTNANAYYQYSSIHQQVEIYYGYAKEILTNAAMNRTMKKDNVVNVMLICNYMLFDKIYRASERINELITIQYDNMRSSFFVLALFLFVGIFICVAFEVAYYNNRISCYTAALYIIKRINPYSLLNNKAFNQMFLKHNDSVKKTNDSIEASIIKNARNAIFCTNLHGIVESANALSTELLGYTQEQILGQTINSFFIQEHNDIVRDKLESMRQTQSSPYFEDDFEVLSDAEKPISVHCVIIGMKENNELNSFVIILQDNSALVKQKKEAEIEKAKSEKLLYQILPRDIVLQLNKGIKDISFNVQYATIVFIDINKFSDYSSNMSPHDIMSNLSYYFAEIDNIAAKYNMINKIKLIGDIYMAATGLFNQEAPPESHAEQTVNFALEFIEHLYEINAKLGSQLEVRIGINSGGPLIAGVLGTDKPLFDIIGDAINVAARLQSTSEPNRVHISTATCELIKPLQFKLTKRGEIFLKGKGTQVTYYVDHLESNEVSHQY